MKPTLPSPLPIEAPRRAQDIGVRLQRLLADAFGGGPGTDPLRDALVAVAARQGEILTGCIDAAATLHVRAFGEYLAGGARPAAAAHVHLAFEVAPGSAPVVVPMRTRVGAQPLPGDKAPAVFETLEDLELMRAKGAGAWYADAGHRQVSDVGALWQPAGRTAGDASPETSWPVVRAWHIGQRDAFAIAGLRSVRLDVHAQATGASGAAMPLEWGMATPTGFVPLVVERDTTDGLTHDGTVVLQAPAAWPIVPIDGVESRWVTVRPRSVVAPLPGEVVSAPASAPSSAPRSSSSSSSGSASASTVRAAVPRLRSVRLRVSAATAPQPPAALTHGEAALDASKDFFPFGERPRFGEVLQVLSPAFAERGAQIQIAIVLTNPHGGRSPPAAPLEPVSREGEPVVVWEILTASGFRSLVVVDDTRALTAHGSVTFTVPDNIATTTVGGKPGTWLRARLASGDYDADVVTAGAHISVARPPSIRTLSVAATIERGPMPAERFVHQGALTSVVREGEPVTPAASFDIFPAPDVDGPALYIAFEGDTCAFAAGRVATLHVRPALASAHAAEAGAAPRWQLHTASGWHDVAARDGTHALMRSGILRLQWPVDAAPWRTTSLDRRPQLAWLRAVWPTGAAALQHLPLGMALNAVAANHTELLRDELLGSSLGRPDQAFAALRKPVIGPALLQVREQVDVAGGWIDWEEVDDFLPSPADARHYTLDRQSGEVRFGDGRHGRIPPAGANNIRLHAYAVGGGQEGNRPALTIAQLRSAVPAVASVRNPEAATGGLNAETDAERHAQASAWLRHRGRAVCADDYADLARKASPEVAVAYCMAGRDLAAPRKGGQTPAPVPGVVSVVVIPQSAAVRPQPSLALLGIARDELDARRAPHGRLVVVGPTYAGVSVRLAFDVARSHSPHAVGEALRARIAQFLHPLDGGDEGRGWPIGRRPHRSDVLALAGSTEGVARVRSVKLALDDSGGEPWIVAAGTIDVTSDATADAGFARAS